MDCLVAITDWRIDADNIRGDAELRAKTGFHPQQALRMRRWRNAVNEDHIVGGAKATDATNPLLQPRRVPWKIQMDQYRSSLKVESLAQHVGGNEERDMLGRRCRACSHS